MATGTYSIADLLKVRFSSAKELGLDTIAATLQADLAVHNQIVTELVSEMCEVGTDARRVYGGSNTAEMTEVDEFGRAPSQKNVGGVECGFPLKLFQYNLGWTRKFLENATVGDLVQGQLDAQKAHMVQIRKEIQYASLRAVNFNFTDHLVDNVVLPVKRFLNADSAAIPDGPNGETFAGASHDHYTDVTPLAVADITGLVDTVVEHGHGNYVKLCISRTDEAAFRALSGFVAYVDPRLNLGAASNQPEKRLDVSRLDNRAIGILGGAEVWVKPWMVANYAMVYDAGDSRKPLYFRQRLASAMQGLRLAAEFDSHPLQAQVMEAEFGIGVWTRTNGAVHYSGNNTWADAV
jgi:hypothetical protein